MSIDQLFEDYFANGERDYLAHISLDCVVFSFYEGHLKVLLLKWPRGELWSLAGGFIRKEEALDAAAYRVLKEAIGIENVYLRQFYTFGDARRDQNKKMMQLPLENNAWINSRFVTVGYYALVDHTRLSLEPRSYRRSFQWCDLDHLPKLLFDHGEIIDGALKALRQGLNDHPIGYNLLPEKFTMPELQRLYETILNKSLDRRNFQKKMLSLGLVKRLNERKTGGAHKAPYYYSFDKKKYEQAINLGLKIGF